PPHTLTATRVAVEVATPAHDGIAPIARLTFPRAVTHAVRPRPIPMIGQHAIRCRFRNSRQPEDGPRRVRGVKSLATALAKTLNPNLASSPRADSQPPSAG